MKAVIRRDRRLVCDEIADLKPAEGQVLVKTLACGICGSDLHALHHMEHMIDLSRRAGAPDSGFDPSADTVFGHEFCAEILDHGPGASKLLKVGTRVVSVPVTLHGGGMEALGFSNRLPGGFAEQMMLSEALILEVPNGLPTDKATLTEPFAVGAHAVAKARLEPKAVSLVVGCGPVGLAVIAALKAQGHGPVIAADFSPRRRAAAERLGADIVIDPATESPHERWEQLGVPKTRAAQTMMRMMGAPIAQPVVFECVGSPGVLQALIEAAPAGSHIVVAGVCMESDKIEPSIAITKEIELTFVFGYTPEEFAMTLRQISEGIIDVSGLVTGTVSLDGVAGAFTALGDPEAHVKILVQPNG
ncbi:MAG: zinc-binding dehydrogenase [Alphaproteobacteria bacterium]|nr:zinc-binding dehydrogenase [Alphaproteobacteria bacterium]MBU1513870.1 zinc-binding dehydrogenase [Alphaproteobacteria bacterium]MBU2094485.1 zinc-binding dehydrogenase [Alphaproteobacteria bacterium]MBU2149789.1 zinc-binding dehydrogenase [Alphaproteobacteria bacterium]MBU2307260.1 zinc-binding dehydrogenase [Alphaproteobacteria bacterium]